MRIYVAHSKKMDYINEIYGPLRRDKELNNHTLLLPHENSSKSNNDREFYKTIDMFIAEVTFAGTGLGIELGWVYDDNIPIYCLHKSGSKISSSVKSITNNIFEYSNEDEFIKIIKSIVEKYDFDNRNNK